MDPTKTMLTPYLNFDGTGQDAMRFYQSVLGGELSLQTFGEAPMDVPDELKDRLLHGVLETDAFVLMASDTPPGSTLTMGNNVHVSLSGPHEDELSKFYEGLSAGGEVTMPLEKQFWGDTYGAFTDKFGINWMVNIVDAQQT